MKYFLKILELISPSITARIAFHFISNPQVRKLRSFEKSILDNAIKSSTIFKKFTIASYQWGKGTKTALLVHGWEGRASNFGAIIPILVESGYRVIGFDAPSHGNSSKRKTNFFDIAELIEVFLKKETYDLVITHSIGSVMTLMAMSKLKYQVNKLIVITTPDKFEEYIEHTVNKLGLTIKTNKAFIKLIRNTTVYEPTELQASLFVKNITVKKALFIHDKDDTIIKIENTKKVSSQMNNSRFIELKNTGHFKILWAEKTLNLVKEHV